ncbi:MAG TPA: hypothetical protein PKM35_08335 [Holophaga sp.]|nr:hypothetical protein [Holophaga sp.]HPS67609.1 hypothetical protein [Holophaga sp.]
MQPETKKIGEMLVEAGLITNAQLQEALRHQRITGGRMGSNLVAMGFISEDLLMDFLAQKTGVPRFDLKNLDIPASVLQRIPKRLADQLNVLPVAFKEPKSLVLAMTDPSDLNAVDSARFASGLNIEPVVAPYSSLKHAIAEQYLKLGPPAPRTVEVGPPGGLDEALPVAFDLQLSPLEVKSAHPPVVSKDYGRDPFFDTLPQEPSEPYAFFGGDDLPDPALEVPATAGTAAPTPLVIHARSSMAPQVRRLDSFQTRTLVLGLIKLLQRRGVVGDDELQRYIGNLIDSGELQDTDKPMA